MHNLDTTKLLHKRYPYAAASQIGPLLHLITRFSLTVGLIVILVGLVGPAWVQAALNPDTDKVDSPDKRGNTLLASQAIFVALNGSDPNGDGSIDNPYRTLKKAANEASPGDTIYVRGGLYTGTKDTIYGINGTAQQPITIRPYPGETVIFDGTNAGISGSESVIVINTSSYIVFEGFEIQNSPGRGLSTYEAHHITIRNNRVHDVQQRGLSGAGDNLVFEGNEVWRAVLENKDEAKSSGWSAVMAIYKRADGSDSTNITIRNNHIHDSWGEGIIPSYADGVVIEGNIVHDTYSVNIYLNRSNGVTVNGNYLYNTVDTYNRSDHGYPAHGISLANEGPSAGQGTYANNVTMANNLIVGTGSGIRYWQAGISDPENTYRNLKIYYNVITGTHIAAIYIDEVDAAHYAPSGVVVQNNIIHAGTNGTTLDIGNPEAWTFSHNNWPNGVPPLATGPNNFSEPPQFVNPTVAGAPTGFKLQSGSSSIGRGTPVDIITDYWGNFRGQQPTVGIHEFFPVVLDKMVYLPSIQK